ncbi:DEKNAAC104739 [Brettanomyces naardenensis]|uniref:DEKNAAC104739 n=1 Tax=Brettanomyces naardenensis TaxID=13370 RepID=A0A448YRI5_BRENA|nr:DEKNAAC104739 [Brettanomyces naardenensis]
MPTLINRSYRELRALNSIDNEEVISNEDYLTLLKDACERSSTRLSDKTLCDDEKLPDLIQGRRRAYSVNETSNFDRDDGTRIEKLKHFAFPKQSYDVPAAANISRPEPPQRTRSRSLEGIEDEYIPDLYEFDLKNFGADESSLGALEVLEALDIENVPEAKRAHLHQNEPDKSQSIVPRAVTLSYISPSPTATSTPFGSSVDSSFSHEKSIIGGLHSQVKPIEIAGRKSRLEGDGSLKFRNDSDLFHAAGSPERAGDKAYLSSLPKNFSSFSFSERKKVLSELLPDSLKENPEYRSHLSKLIRRNSLQRSRNSSTAVGFLNSFSLGGSSFSAASGPPDNVNECGSVVMGEWRLGNTFNRGAFGIIRDCQNIHDSADNRAIKVIDVYDSSDFEQRFKTEILMWSLMNHENILPLQDFVLTNKWFFLLMPKVLGGSLFDIVKMWEAYRLPITERFQKIKQFLVDIGRALHYMHSMGAYHGDVKLENCLVDSEHGSKVLLCDFGMANFFKENPQSRPSTPGLTKRLLRLKPMNQISNASENEPVSPHRNRRASTISTNGRDHFPPEAKLSHRLPDERIGSLPYASPELVQPVPKELDDLSDMWAFGIMVYTLVTFKLPFCHKFEPRVKMQIIHCDYDYGAFEQEISSLHDPSTSRIMDEILHGCLQGDRSQRLTSKAVLSLLSQL